MPGRPDIYFARAKLCIFLDGCFWHKCPKHFKMPKTNLDYWIPKIQRTVERDRNTRKLLLDTGHEVLRFWEHEVRADPDCVVAKISDAINQALANPSDG